MKINSDWGPTSGLACGLASGLGQSALFNAYDRALYHSIVNRRPFLDPANWRGNPFAGISPSFLQRSVSAGLYFPLEDLFRRKVSSNYAIDGILVGLVGGAFTTPFNCVKYAMWSNHSSAQVIDQKSPPPAMIETAKSLYNRGGLPRLFRGVAPTLYRDMTFGITFSVLRHQGDNGFINNVLAAFIATTVSSPFNYARMKVYGTPLENSIKSTFTIIKELQHETIRSSDSLISRAQYTLRSLNVDWGALRVGLGMGIGSQIYNSCVRITS